MAYDSLAGDQRAVLQLVLARRRGYEEIASMLSLAPEAVRGRALDALDALGGPTELDVSERRLIGDYLLSQLPPAQEAAARELLAASPQARAWALALTPALEPVAVDPLPRIPPAAPEGAAAPDGSGGPGTPDGPDGATERPPSSRRGGIVVIALAAAVIIAAVVVLLVTRPHSHTPSNLAADTHSTATSTTSSTTSTTSTNGVKYLAQINLRPVKAGSRAVGIAEIVQEHSVRDIALLGQHIPPNTKHNSYEVWLYSSPTHFEKLGFVSPAVGRKGTFSAAQRLPANAAGYKELIVTTETAQRPTHPGPILLRGRITGLS